MWFLKISCKFKYANPEVLRRLREIKDRLKKNKKNLPDSESIQPFLEDCLDRLPDDNSFDENGPSNNG